MAQISGEEVTTICRVAVAIDGESERFMDAAVEAGSTKGVDQFYVHSNLGKATERSARASGMLYTLEILGVPKKAIDIVVANIKEGK